MRKFVTFIFGVTIGVLVTLYYELAAKQPQPRIARHNVVMRYVSDDEVGAWQLDQWQKESE